MTKTYEDRVRISKEQADDRANALRGSESDLTQRVASMTGPSTPDTVWRVYDRPNNRLVGPVHASVRDAVAWMGSRRWHEIAGRVEGQYGDYCCTPMGDALWPDSGRAHGAVGWTEPSEHT